MNGKEDPRQRSRAGGKEQIAEGPPPTEEGNRKTQNAGCSRCCRRGHREARGTRMVHPQSPLSSQSRCRTTTAPKAKLDDTIKDKLEAAKEQLEDAVWLDPIDMAGRIPYRRESNGRLKEISHKLSYFLRGHALADGYASPVMEYTDLSMEWGEVREYLCSKVHNVVDWEILQVIRSSSPTRQPWHGGGQVG